MPNLLDHVPAVPLLESLDHWQVMGGCDQESIGSGDLYGYRGCLVRCQSTGGAGWWHLPFQLHSRLWFAVG